MLLLDRSQFEKQAGRMPNTNASSKHPHQRHPSRPNSASSSSVVTVQRTASLSSGSGSRTPHTKVRPQSPSESSHSLPLAQGTLSPDQARRPSGGNSRPNSVGGIKEGVGNLNRWSQSTTSSMNSGNGHHKRGSLSRRLSLGGNGSLSSLKSITNPHSPPSRNAPTKSRSSPNKAPTEPPPPPPGPEMASINALPTIITLPTLSQAVDNASTSTGATATPATIDLLTPSTYNGADYFGEKWKGKSPVATTRAMEQRLAPSPIDSSTSSSSHARTTSVDPVKLVPAPESTYSPERIPAKRSQSRDNYRGGHTRSIDEDENGKGSGGTGGGSSTSSVRSERRYKMPSQKAMLSKALQKANTAVLLDNAQNFEGAMEAYADACHLLQQVMDRSSGDEDKRKLEAIVSDDMLTVVSTPVLTLPPPAKHLYKPHRRTSKP
jgi:hypothetical protein